MKRHRVFKLYNNYEKEEIWLNEMAAKGFHCVDYCFGRYLFERGTPGEYIYRIQLLEYMPKHPESIPYLEFLEETGVEMIASHLRWVYLRKKAADGPFELFSDQDSRIKHYKQIIFMFLPLIAINLFFGLGFIVSRQIINLANLTAGTALLIPCLIYFRRLRKLQKDSQIYE